MYFRRRTLGEHNYIATVVWQGGRKNDSRYVSVGHDYLMIYARNEAHLQELGTRWRERKTGVDDALAFAHRAWKESGHDPAAATRAYRTWLSRRSDITPAVGRFKSIDDAGRVYNADKDLGWPGGGGPRYDVLHPVTGRPVTVPSTGWRFTEPKLKEQIAAGLVEFGRDEKKIPRGKTFLDELDSQVAESVFTQIRTTASQRMGRLVGAGVFEYPKDELVLARWFDLVTGADPRAIVLDFFAGSGSSAHAVMMQNVADGGSRQFIMVQVDESVDTGSDAAKAGYTNIAELSRERIRRAGKEILSQAGLTAGDLDVGFRTLRVGTTNMADLLRTPDALDQHQLDGFTDSVKPGRTGEDLLFQVLLDWGLTLDLPIEREIIDGREVFTVDGGALVACFDAEVSLDAVRAIAKREPLRAVFRDSGFASDADRINAEQIFAEVSPSTDIKAI